MPKAGREASLGDLLVQMKVTNRLLAAPLKTSLGQKPLIALLASTGATAQEIADVLDTTAPTIANTLYLIKKDKKSGKKAR
jgi:hypothetical protein